MTYRHKLSRRLAMLRNSVFVGLTLTAAGCRDNGPLGSTLDPLDSPSEIIALLASSDNPTVAPEQPTPMRAVALTKAGHHESIEADWMALDGGLLRDSLVGKELVTFFSADEPGEYRLVSFDRGKRFRDTTRVTVPNQGVSIAKMYVTPAIAALVAGGSQQFFIYGTTEEGDSVPVAAMLQDAPGGSASGLVYTAGDTAGEYTITFKRQGGPESVDAQIAITVPKASTPLPPLSEPVPAPVPQPEQPAPVEPTPVEPAPMPPIGASPAELPRVQVDTRWPTNLSGRRVVVPAGGDLQAALNAAQRGDVIELAPGASYVGNFKLPAKAGTGWIVITTATTLPPEGTRVTPTMAAGFAKIVTSNSMPALVTAPSGDASYYRIAGVEFRSSAPLTYNLVFLGDIENAAPLGVQNMPTHIILDRVWAHGTATQNLRRCVGLNTRTSAVIDSWISDCHEAGADAQAIAGWGGPGPYKIVNNYLEASGENILFGGVDPREPGLVPSDIVIERNYFFKPMSWKTSGAWLVKNLFELKNAQRVLVRGNVFENNWSHGQTGFAILMKSANQSGRCTWCVTQDVTFEYNKIINSPGGFNFSAVQAENGGGAVPMNDVVIRHNVLEDVALLSQPGDQRMFQLLGALSDITIEHNTGFGENVIVMFDGATGSGLVFRNNLLTRGRYGIFGGGTAEGNGALARYAPDGIVRGNVLIGAPATTYPAGNSYPQSVLLVGLSDYAGGNYSLTTSSPYATVGVDGVTPGADVATLRNVLTGVTR